MSPMRARFPGSLRTLLAALQVAMIGAWSPVMMAQMADVRPGADPMPGMHHDIGMHHDGHPLECCALCPLTCAAPVGIASAPVPLPFPPAVGRIAAPATRIVAPDSPGQRRLPFPLGPPTLRTV